MRLFLPRVVVVVASLLTALLVSPRGARAQGSGSEAPVAATTAKQYAPFTPLALPPPSSTRTTPIVTTKPPDLTEYVGQPITRVRVVLEGETWEDVALPVVKSVRPGELLTPAVARRALDEVLASGAFARGDVSVRKDGMGVVLVVAVTPRKLVETLLVDLHGAKLERDEVLREADLVQGGELVASDVAQQKARIERLCLRRGYPSAAVTVTTRATDDPRQVLVLVDVVPGAERVVEKRWSYVEGAPADDVRTLVDAYLVNVGDRADDVAMQAADIDLETRMRLKGWQRAKVFHDLVLSSKLVTLRVKIETGPRYVLRFEGNESYDADALGGALSMEEDTDRSPSHLVEKLKAFYAKRGFLDAEIVFEMRGQEADQVRAMMFKIIEHPRVRVASRTYPCLKTNEISKLTGAGPKTSAAIGVEIDSYLEEELPGADLLKLPNPRGVDKVIGPGAGDLATGARPVPLDLNPDATLVHDTYERALTHVEELYRNEGYLHALVGPLIVLRARCSPRSPPGKCVPLPLPAMPTDQCTYDAQNLPVPVPRLDSAYTCVPDPARGVECAPNVQLFIPVKLGPRTFLYDAALVGVKALPERDLAAAGEIPLGEPVNGLKLEDVRRKMIDAYKELGFAFADIKYTIEPSIDNTRARVRFEVQEGEQVIVKDVVVRGNVHTRDSVIRRRVALRVNEPFRASDARKTQERVATLGVFTSVSVSLEDPYVPTRYKTVVITVVERPSQYVEHREGFSTGEGVRGALEYGHRNLGGYAVSVTARSQLSYLPSEFIIDPVVRRNFEKLNAGERLARRLALTIGVPEVGLGPLIRAQADFITVRDLERDFALTKYSFFGALIYRPARVLQISGGQSVERNSVFLFNAKTIDDLFRNLTQQFGTVNTDLQRLLRVPQGDSLAFAQRFVLTWDRRDNAFNAHKGTFWVTGLELVNSQPLDGPPDSVTGQFNGRSVGHFVRLTQTVAGYIPVSNKVTFAAELRFGQNIHLTADSQTYPDRLFFLGGVDSMRGFLPDSFVPQDVADRIVRDAPKALNDPKRTTIDTIGIRGGDLMINPRFELRFPVKPPFDSVLFADFGNVWKDASNVLDHPFGLRATVGTGIRWVTPVGPLVFDYGINVRRRPYEDFGAFHFAIGLF